MKIYYLISINNLREKIKHNPLLFEQQLPLKVAYALMKGIKGNPIHLEGYILIWP